MFLINLLGMEAEPRKLGLGLRGRKRKVRFQVTVKTTQTGLKIRSIHQQSSVSFTHCTWQLIDFAKDQVWIILCLASFMVTIWLPVASKACTPHLHPKRGRISPGTVHREARKLLSWSFRQTCFSSHGLDWATPHPCTNYCCQDMLIGLSPHLEVWGGRGLCFFSGTGAAWVGWIPE